MKIRQLLMGFIQNKYLVKSMVTRDIKQRYSGSLLGMLWLVFQPLSTILIYTFVFSFIMKVRLGPEFGDTNFTMWLLSGLVPWMFFSEVVNRSVNAVLDNATLLKKTMIDAKWIIISNTIVGLFNFVIISFLLFSILAIFKVYITFKIIYALLFIIALCIFALGISFMLSAANVYLRDIGQIVGVFLNIWFYLTPIIYPVNLIPESYRMWIEINPLYQMLDNYRMLILTDVSVNWSALIYSGLFSAISLFIGLKFFLKLQKGFVDVL